MSSDADEWLKGSFGCLIFVIAGGVGCGLFFGGMYWVAKLFVQAVDLVIR